MLVKIWIIFNVQVASYQYFLCFFAEKEQQQAAEIEFYLREVSSLKQEKQSLQREMHQLQVSGHMTHHGSVCTLHSLNPI